MTSAPDPTPWGNDAGSPYASAEEVAFGLELNRLHPVDRESQECDEPVLDVEAMSGAALLEAMSLVPAAADLMLLDSIDPMGLPSKHAILDYLGAAERIDALLTARKARARVALAGAQSTEQLQTELHVEHELAVATRTSKQTAGLAIELARALTTTFPSFLTALASGRISAAHCTVLVKKTRCVTDAEALAAIERVTLPKAVRMTPGQFGSEVAKAIATHDPDAAGRFVRAREQRAVWTRELDDGLSYLGVVHDTSTITAIKARIDAAATVLCEERGGRVALLAGEEDAARGACRADALAAIVLGTEDSDGGTTWIPEPANVQVQLVIDLATLRGEVDRHCLLDGQPVPAAISRELAGYATAFRRIVTDPVTGHLLDYGRTTYLPAPLRTYVMARDGGCRAPGCTARDPRRTQMDHALEFPTGPSNTANTGCACIAHHQLKTSGFLTIDNSAADGSCDWVTAWGQRVHIPARPFLHDPADHPPPEPDPPPDDEPPF